MRTISLSALVALACFAGSAAAQSTGEGQRGSTPPGMSQDGAHPSEGALKGGTLAPGESGGTPQSAPAQDKPSAGSAAAGGSAKPGSSHVLSRCYQLEGSLREQCLADEASKTGAGSRAPSAGSPAGRD